MKNHKNSYFLFLSCLGILILLFLSVNLAPKMNDISQISLKDLNKKILTEGKVIKISKIDEQSYFTVIIIENKNKDKIDVICNCNNPRIIVNETLRVIGTLNEYKGNFQINSEKIDIKS
ncbi:MAG TPA: hypothetical protein VI815_04210 [Candidatus Nanoarchaeia archaeon]|nr:hypothetical protein [Candidatus Nanoarchaeia archaeon]